MAPDARASGAAPAVDAGPEVSAAQRRLNTLARYVEKPALALIADQRALRRVVALYTAIFFRRHPDMRFAATRLEHAGRSVPALWCDQGEATRRAVVLYFHGGAYTLGGPASHRHLAAGLAGACGTRALLVDYRLAPEHPFPAAVDDAETAYRALLDDGWRGDQIVLAGDSAGGGLAFALLHQVTAHDLPRPRCMIGLSPWADLTCSGPSFTANAASEAMLPKAWILRARRLYLRGADPRDPRASPIHGDFQDAPPCLLLASRDERLRDDSRRLEARLRAFGAVVTYHEVPGVQHVWPLHLGRSPEADQAIRWCGEFVRSLA